MTIISHHFSSSRVMAVGRTWSKCTSWFLGGGLGGRYRENPQTVTILRRICLLE